jgi:hypothetical protein
MQAQAYVADCSGNCIDVGVHHQLYGPKHPITTSCSSDCEDFHLKETSEHLYPITEDPVRNKTELFTCWHLAILLCSQVRCGCIDFPKGEGNELKPIQYVKKTYTSILYMKAGYVVHTALHTKQR